MNEKDKILLEKSVKLKDLLKDFKTFMKIYERDEECQLFAQHGKDSLDYVIGEFEDIINVLQ